MAESAVPEVSLSVGSEPVFEGNNTEAGVYCRDCHEHLCGECIKDHKKFSSMKHHQLVDKDDMPGTQDDLQVRDVCTEGCPDHREEITKYFCPDHNASTCGDCVTLSHKISKADSRISKNINATHEADINVKSEDNESGCQISGMVAISKDLVVVADNYNASIKLIHTGNNAIISELTPEDKPWDVTVCRETVAATLPDVRKIVFVKYDRGLVHDRDISVDGRCVGIHCYGDKLYVVFNEEKKLEVMTTTGVVLHRFTTTDTGEQIFDSPWYVFVYGTKKRIYVSDFYMKQLIALDMDGKQTGAYKDDELDGPAQLAVDKTGPVYLCDFGTDTVHLLSPDGEKLKVLLTRHDGLDDLTSVCYCKDTQRLYLGMSICDTVKVYHIS